MSPFRVFRVTCPNCDWIDWRSVVTQRGSCAPLVDTHYENIVCPVCGEEGILPPFDEWTPQMQYEVSGERAYLDAP